MNAVAVAESIGSDKKVNDVFVPVVLKVAVPVESRGRPLCHQ